MRINSKGFILIETLAVTVFAASIFVFLFKSVSPLMGYYNAKTEQMGNIDSVFNNYNIRKFVYRDDYFNNPTAVNNNTPIKNEDYALITCNDAVGRFKLRSDIPSGDRKYFKEVYAKDYCNSLMEKIGAREKTDDKYKDRYLLFYVKKSKLKKFLENGLDFFASYHVALGGENEGDNYDILNDPDTRELFENSIKEITESSDFQNNTNDGKAYLVLYYFYNNPEYIEDVDSKEPKFKDTINIMTMVTSNDNLNCFKYQIIPGYQYFYQYKLTAAQKTAFNASSNKYYFFHEAYDYDNYQRFNEENKSLEENINACSSYFEGRSKNNVQFTSVTAKIYCERLLTRNSQFYTVYKLFGTDGSTDRCKNYFKDKVKKYSITDMDKFCGEDKFNNREMTDEWPNFVDARFAERMINLDDSNLHLEVAIIGYDKTCARDVVIPETVYGYPITMIGYRAFQNSRVRSIKLTNNIKVIDKNAVTLYDANIKAQYEAYIADNNIFVAK